MFCIKMTTRSLLTNRVEHDFVMNHDAEKNREFLLFNLSRNSRISIPVFCLRTCWEIDYGFHWCVAQWRLCIKKHMLLGMSHCKLWLSYCG